MAFADCPEGNHPAEAGLTRDAVHVLRCVVARFGMADIGGVRDQPPDSDHATGRAVDVMIPQWNTGQGRAVGWRLAAWARSDAATLGVHYIIFDKRIWNAERDHEGWRPYTRYGPHPNPTLGHLDHVHISVYGDRGQAAERHHGNGLASKTGHSRSRP